MTLKNKLIKLVGLQYYLSVEQREEFFKSGSNASILIKPDKENPKDKTALEAFDDDWNKIANVSMQDKHIVWMIISNSEEEFVKAHVKDVDAEKNYVYVSIDGFDLGKTDSTFTYNRYEDLKISCPILPKPEIVSCLHLAYLQAKKLLESAISGNTNSNQKLYKHLKYFIEHYYYDISIEADIERQTLINLMSQMNNKEYDLYLEKMKYIGTHKGTILSNVRNLGDWLMKTEKSNMDKLVKLKFDDEFVEKVKIELSEFPNELYDIYLQRPNDFLSNVYYSCLSRNVVAMLLSGIIFIDANEKRDIDKHLNSIIDDKPTEILIKEKNVDNITERPACGILNNKDVFINCVKKTIKDKSKTIVWRVLYSILKTHNKFGYEGNLSDYYNEICIGVFNVKLTCNAISKSRSRFMFYKGDKLIEDEVRKELPEIDNFYKCVDEYFKLKLNEYIN